MILILILPIESSCVVAIDPKNEAQVITSGSYGKGYRYNIQGWVYLHLEGEPYQRGYQYGYLASAEIIDMMNRWGDYRPYIAWMPKFILKSLLQNDDKLSEQWWEICKRQSMKYFEKHVPEEYQREMQGMVDGLNAKGARLFEKNIDYEDIVASQFVQEVQYTILHSPRRFFHPFRNILFGVLGVFFKNRDSLETGFCRALLATGNATTDGGIIVAHTTIFPKYIAERCNFIVDIKPSTGYRFMMTSPPGSLWSEEDYYQNEKGIVLTETEFRPQGPFNIRKTPKGIRSRTAIQYSSSIDEVIDHLQKGNNGLIPNEWLIGDTKTGEIARLEQALFHTPVIRTKNGIFTSSCYPHDKKVERELWGCIPKILALKLYPNKYTYTVSLKFDELEKQYYGKIDIEIVKKILTTFPISEDSTDVKITTSTLMEKMGLLTYFGRPIGCEWIPGETDIRKFKDITILPPSGWLELFPCQSNPIILTPTKKTDDQKHNEHAVWQFETGLGNTNYSSCVVEGEVIYVTTSAGAIYALEKSSGKKIWSKHIGKKSIDPVVSGKFLYVGTNKGVYALNTKTGGIVWQQLIGDVVSKPSIDSDIIIVSFSNNEIHALNIDTGHDQWSFKFNSSAYVSPIINNMIFIGSGASCYGFDIDRKKILWEYTTKGQITASPQLFNGTVFIGSWDGVLYALNASRGDLQWMFQTGWGIDSTPAVSNGLVFLGSLDNNFYAVEQDTGNLRWFYPCNAAIHSNPFIYGECVFFGCDDGRIYALNTTKGDLTWSYTPRYSIDEYTVHNYITTPILSNPFVHQRVVYFGANGMVYALDAQTVEIADETIQSQSFVSFDVLLVIGILILMCTVVLLLTLRKKAEPHHAEAKKNTALKRSLSVWEVTLMGVGSILGAGIYIVIGEAAGLSGNSLWLSFILAAILAIFTGLSYAELSSRFPRSGAEYVYVENSFGKTTAWLVGWLILVGSIIGGATVAIGFSNYFSAIFGTPILLVAMGMLFLVGIILILGIKETASITIIFTLIEAAGLIIIICIGIPFIGSVEYFDATKGISGLINAGILIFFSYIGFEGISRLAEETKNPEKNIPKAIIYSIIIVTIIYALVGVAALSIVGWQELSASKAPIATIVEKVLGGNSFLIISAIALFATFNTVLFILLSGSRFVYGMAEERALPSSFLRISKRFKTPWVAIIVIVISAMVFLFLQDLTILANLTNFAIIMVFIFVNASVIYYRYKMPIQKGFRIPLSIGRFPVIPFVGIVMSCLMIINLSMMVLLLGMMLIGIGFITNYFVKWKYQ